METLNCPLFVNLSPIPRQCRKTMSKLQQWPLYTSTRSTKVFPKMMLTHLKVKLLTSSPERVKLLLKILPERGKLLRERPYRVANRLAGYPQANKLCQKPTRRELKRRSELLLLTPLNYSRTLQLCRGLRVYPHFVGRLLFIHSRYCSFLLNIHNSRTDFFFLIFIFFSFILLQDTNNYTHNYNKYNNNNLL